MRPFLKMTVRQWWEDTTQATDGTWMLWLVSRANLDQKNIVACAVRCAREVLPLFADPSKPAAALDAIQAWCEGRGSREDALHAGDTAFEAASAARGTAQFVAWSAIHQAARCVRSVVHATGVAGTVAEAMRQGGKGTVPEWESRLAGIVRSAFTWDEIQRAISDGRPSPQPRPATADAVQDQAKSRMAEYDKALAAASAAFGQLEEFCSRERLSLDGVSRLLGSDGLGDGLRRLVDGTVSGMAAVDARDATGRPAEAPKPPKRGRMMV